ncbi:MAG: GNAT family N-acetyltransferase [Actinomycetota bacterium]
MPCTHPRELGAGRVRLRSPVADDIETLVELWQEPEVARWWPHVDLAAARSLLEDPGITALVIEVSGSVAGFLQIWEEEEPDYRHAGIDLMVGSAHQGRGVGPEAIRIASRWLFDECGHHRITIDPAAANTRARKAYEKVGFELVGILRSYERDPEGRGWRDGALYDLLAEDLD